MPISPNNTKRVYFTSTDFFFSFFPGEFTSNHFRIYIKKSFLQFFKKLCIYNDRLMTNVLSKENLPPIIWEYILRRVFFYFSRNYVYIITVWWLMCFLMKNSFKDWHMFVWVWMCFVAIICHYVYVYDLQL